MRYLQGDIRTFYGNKHAQFHFSNQPNNLMNKQQSI